MYWYLILDAVLILYMYGCLKLDIFGYLILDIYIRSNFVFLSYLRDMCLSSKKVFQFVLNIFFCIYYNCQPFLEPRHVSLRFDTRQKFDNKFSLLSFVFRTWSQWTQSTTNPSSGLKKMIPVNLA